MQAIGEFNRTLYPFKSNFLTLANGHRYHYVDEGAGEPVVMLHGNPTWSFYFRNLIQSLSGRYRCIVPDHIGCGLSDKPSDKDYSYTLRQRTDDVEALLDHLGIRGNVTLVLHDWGGMIGMTYATRHPDRIARVVIMNTGAFQLPSSKPFPWPLRLGKTALGNALIRGMNAFARIAAAVCCTQTKLPRDVKQALLAPYNSWANRVAVSHFVQDIPLTPQDASYALVKQVEKLLPIFREHPVLAVWGERDFVFDHHFLEQWTRIWPQAEVVRFANAGHYILEDATSEVLRHIDGFFERFPVSQSSTRKAAT